MKTAFSWKKRGKRGIMERMVNASPDTGLSSAPARREGISLVVTQPEKMIGILEHVNRITEKSASGPAHDGPAGGGAAATQGGAQTQGPSPRDQAIANIPLPAVVQAQLAEHIQQEVRMLRREAGKITRMSSPGAAYQLTLIYARIRRLNALLAELIDASLDVLKRLFIRVFIDRQPII